MAGGESHRTMKNLFKKIYLRRKHFIKFSLSSFTAFLVDYSIYSLILAIGTEHVNFLSLTFANVAARIISSTLNFNINRKLVFKSRKNVWESAVEYFSLAAAILFGNSLVLNFFANVLDINHYFAKILTEIIFFLFNFTIQSFVIFRNKKQ